MKNKIEAYNLANTLLVITSFPNPAGKSGKRELNAVGWHSEKTLKFLAKNRKVLVLAEQLPGIKSFFAGKNLLVKRVWKKGNPFSILSLYRFIKKNYDLVSSVFVQFEFNVFGGILPNLFLLLVMTLLRLSGKKVTFELHQVIFDVGQLKKHINVGNPLFQLYYNLGLRFFYFILGLVTDKIIVFEQELKNRLVSLINPAKIEVLSLAVQMKKGLSLTKAKGILEIPKDTFVLMVFGFINGYKGIDWILKEIAKIKSKKLRLVIAGGKNPYLTGQPAYEKFYQSILDLAAKDQRVITTGFIPDKEIGLYFSAANLVVLPYEVFMSASGPFSWAMSYKKPVIFSEKLYDYSYSGDFQEALRESEIHSRDIFFRFSQKSFPKLLGKITRSKRLARKLVKFSSVLAEKRKLEKVGQRYEEITKVASSVVFFPSKARLAPSLK